jgi:hypothetical protein
MAVGRAQRSGNDFAVGSANRKNPRDLQQFLSRLFLQLPPEIISPENERHISRIFKISFPDHPGLPVGSA